MRLLEDEEAPRRNPLLRVEVPRVGRAEQPWTFLDRAELSAYLTALEEEPEPWATLLLCALDAGLRVGELVALAWPSIDLDQRRLRVCASSVVDPADRELVTGPPKSGHDRTVGLTARLAARLRTLPSRFVGGRVFLLEGEPILPDQNRYPHRRTLARAGITRPVRVHDLRHTWASHLAMGGAPLASIQQLGGWGSLAMVQRYAHLSVESVVDQVQVLEESGGATRVGNRLGTDGKQ